MTWYLKAKKSFDYSFFENVFSNKEIEEIKKLTNNIIEKNATISNSQKIEEVNESYRNTSIKWIHPCANSEYIFRKITDYVNAANEKWFNFDLTCIEPLQYSIYYEKCFYEKHIDSFHEAFENPRKLSFVIQLTDENEYTGGSTLLWTSKNSHAITKKKGSMTLFPSYVLHEVTPIESGTREAIVGWVQGPAFK